MLFSSRLKLIILYLHISFCLLQRPFHFSGTLPNASLVPCQAATADRSFNLPTEVFLSKSSPFVGCIDVRKGISSLFGLRYGKACSHVKTKVIQSTFTDEISNGWGFDTLSIPFPPPATSLLLHNQKAK